MPICPVDVHSLPSGATRLLAAVSADLGALQLVLNTGAPYCPSLFKLQQLQQQLQERAAGNDAERQEGNVLAAAAGAAGTVAASAAATAARSSSSSCDSERGHVVGTNGCVSPIALSGASTPELQQQPKQQQQLQQGQQQHQPPPLFLL